jgi:hypothetical protein
MSFVVLSLSHNWPERSEERSTVQAEEMSHVCSSLTK